MVHIHITSQAVIKLIKLSSCNTITVLEVTATAMEVVTTIALSLVLVTKIHSKIMEEVSDQ